MRSRRCRNTRGRGRGIRQGDPPAVHHDGLAPMGDVAELIQHEPGDGLVVAVGHLESGGIEHLARGSAGGSGQYRDCVEGQRAKFQALP